jgi:hypothetical protein
LVGNLDAFQQHSYVHFRSGVFTSTSCITITVAPSDRKASRPHFYKAMLYCTAGSNAFREGNIDDIVMSRPDKPDRKDRHSSFTSNLFLSLTRVLPDPSPGQNCWRRVKSDQSSWYSAYTDNKPSPAAEPRREPVEDHVGAGHGRPDSPCHHGTRFFPWSPVSRLA